VRAVTALGRLSAGLLLWRIGPQAIEVLLAHPGGPFWASRDLGAWTIPKGEVEPGEDARAVANSRRKPGSGPMGRSRRWARSGRKRGSVWWHGPSPAIWMSNAYAVIP
jgi:hypothetical protein